MAATHPIRLFADAHVFDQEHQGSRTFIKELYNELAQDRSLQLYMASHDIDRLAAHFPANANIRFIPYKHRSGWSRLLFNINPLLKQYAIDVAHFQYILPPRKLRSCRYIVTIHDVIFEDYPGEFTAGYRLAKKMLYGMAAAKADMITTVSGFSGNSIERFLDVPQGKTEIIPNGVHERFFRPYDKQLVIESIKTKFGFSKYILYVSRFEPRKDHAGLLQAYLSLRLYEQGYSLVLPGHRSLPVKAFDDLLDSIPAAIRRFIFIPTGIADEDLPDLYRAASLFVYPSRAEGFGIPPLEAAATRVPVICSNTSALQDFTFFGPRHIPAGDTELLAQTMRLTLDSPPAEDELASIAATVQERYSWKRSARQFSSMVHQLVRSSIKHKPETHDTVPLP